MDKKIIRKGLELLRQLEGTNLWLKQIIQEKKIPPIMLLFLSNYEIGISDNMFLEQTYPYGLHKVNISVALYTNNYTNRKEINQEEEYEGYFREIISYEELVKEYEEYEKRIEEWHQEGFIKIGYMGSFTDLILLGVEEKNLDEIWIFGNEIWSCTSNFYEKFASNIFDFMSTLEQYWSNEHLLEEGIDPSRVYKNWGEDLWRIKEEKEES